MIAFSNSNLTCSAFKNESTDDSFGSGYVLNAYSKLVNNKSHNCLQASVVLNSVECFLE